jgi:hypothetical protein
MADLTTVQMVSVAFSTFGAALGSYLGQRSQQRKLRSLIREIFWEQSKQMRDRIDALEKVQWGNARKWHLTPPENPSEETDNA